MLSLDNIREIIFEEGGLEDIVVAGEICTRENIIYVTVDDTLLTATEKLGIKDLGAIPVVQETDGKLYFKGLLRRGDIIMQYNKTIASTRPVNA